MDGTKEVLDDGIDFEQGFNDALSDLRKSLSLPATEKLEKAKKPADDEDPEEDDESKEEEDNESEEDDDEMKKSLEDRIREDSEAAAAMDVEPFLLQLVKAMDEGISEMGKTLGKRIAVVEKLAKSIGNATLMNAELNKSMSGMIQQIGGTALPTQGIRSLRKSRFDNGDGKITEVNPREILIKSREWVKAGKINLVDAGNIESRINKGRLGQTGDSLDLRVAALLKEEK